MAAAQRSVEVDGFLWWRGQCCEKQIIVEAAQIITTKCQPGCRLACTHGLVLKTHRTLKREHTEYEFKFLCGHTLIRE